MVVSQLFFTQKSINFTSSIDDQKSFCNNSYMYINIQLPEKGTTLKEGDEHHVLMEI